MQTGSGLAAIAAALGAAPRRGPRHHRHHAQSAEAAEATERELAAVREQLAQRDAADAARVCEGVLREVPRPWRPDPAMEADAASSRTRRLRGASTACSRSPWRPEGGDAEDARRDGTPRRRRPHRHRSPVGAAFRRDA